MSTDLKRGDLVWAKMRGCASWPGRIVPPKPHIKKPAKKIRSMQFIRFFGTNDYAWVDDINIKPYLEFKSTLIESSKSHSFKKAVADIEDFIENQKDNPDHEMVSEDAQDDDFDTLKEESPKKRKISGIKRERTPSTKSAMKKRRRDSDENESPTFGNHISSRSFEEGHARSSMLEPQSPTMEANNGSDAAKNRTVEASTLTFGFLGLGAMGTGIVKNLIHTGHRVNIWNRTIEKAKKFKEEAEIEHPGLVGTYSTPCDVVQNSDIIFCCVSDPAAVKDILHGEFGILHNTESLEGKGYVEMTTVDTETSMYICNLITGQGGRYLEAQLQGSQQEAGDRNLIVLAAGNKSLYYDCYSCFKAIGHTVYYLGAVGFGTKLNLVLQVIKGVALAGLTEAIALATRSGVAAKDVVEVFNLTNVASPYLKKKAELIVDSVEEHGNEKPLDHMHKDTKLALQLADSLKQPLLMTATANELYKHNRELSLQNER